MAVIVTCDFCKEIQNTRPDGSLSWRPFIDAHLLGTVICEADYAKYDACLKAGHDKASQFALDEMRKVFPAKVFRKDIP